MWRSNPTWGSPRIVGELRKLGITVSKSTVEKYRLQVRKPPSPTWKAFLNNHMKDIVACDFFTVPTIQCRVLFVFILLAHERRRMVHVNITDHPTAQWPTQQIAAYSRLLSHLENYRRIPVLGFDEAAATEFQRLRRRLRLGTMDLKIAAVVLSRGAMLLSRNLGDLNQIPELHVEDWTSPC